MLHQKVFFYAILLLEVYSKIIVGQEIGKIFILSDAESQFGTVECEFILEKDVLKSMLKNTLNYVMFNNYENDLTILGDDRIVLFSSNTYVEKDDVFHLYSKTNVEKLMSLGNSKFCNFQKREKAFTIQNGQFVLEFSIPCPPMCH